MKEEERTPILRPFAIDVLYFLAWINLIGGIITSIVILINKFWTEPLWIGIALAIVIESILVWGLLITMIYISDNLEEIRKNTSKRNK